jgi:exopolyphosphatase/guanosine-5'-triphosphate,3'-diphosphate pyrophosphatase
MRVGLIDIGTNTTKILIADSAANEPIVEIDQTAFPCRLLHQAKDKETIDLPSVNSLIHCLSKLAQQAKEKQVTHLIAVATEGLRRAKNSSKIVQRVATELGISITILSGIEEAEAIAHGILTDPELSDLKSFFALDIGGGSIELIRVHKRKCEAVQSLPLGAARLVKRFIPDPNLPYDRNHIRKMDNFVRATLDTAKPLLTSTLPDLVGCGGTLVHLRKIIPDAGSEIPIKTLASIRKELAVLPIEDRVSQFPQVPQDRADIFPAGLIALESVLRFLGHSSITHSYHNLRHGLIGRISQNGSLFSQTS